MYFFVSNSYISLQMTKFPGNQVPQFPTFSSHAYGAAPELQLIYIVC